MRQKGVRMPCHMAFLKWSSAYCADSYNEMLETCNPKQCNLRTIGTMFPIAVAPAGSPE